MEEVKDQRLPAVKAYNTSVGRSAIYRLDGPGELMVVDTNSRQVGSIQVEKLMRESNR